MRIQKDFRSPLAAEILWAVEVKTNGKTFYANYPILTRVIKMKKPATIKHCSGF
jgi:hypothetical protein